MDKITGSANPDPVALNELLFADDQAIFHEDPTTLQEHTDIFNDVCEKYDMKISISKTETMAVCREPQTLGIDINGTELKQTSEFKYLGSIFAENARTDTGQGD